MRSSLTDLAIKNLPTPRAWTAKPIELDPENETVG